MQLVDIKEANSFNIQITLDENETAKGHFFIDDGER